SLILVDTLASNVFAPDHPLALVWTTERYEALVELLESGWGRPGFLAKLDPDGALDPEDLARWDRYFRLAASPATAAAMGRMLLELDMRDVLTTVRLPTLVIRTTSPYATPEIGRQVAGLIREARVVDLPGAKSLGFGGAGLIP